MILQGPGVPYRLRMYEPVAEETSGTLRFEMYGYDANIYPAVQEFLFSENKVGEDFWFDVTLQTPEQVDAWQYLRQTDWYTIREADTGEPTPHEVEVNRESARMILEDV